MKIILTISLCLLMSPTLCGADEPLWTDEQWIVRSDAVFVGTVESIEFAGKLNEHEDLLRAVVSVDAIVKSSSFLDKTKVIVFYELSATGDNGRRCPTYARLERGKRATFFAVIRDLNDYSNVLFLEMGQSVKEME